MKTKPYIAALFMIVSLSSANAAGSEAGAIAVDLDGDGKPEKVSWTQFAHSEDMGDYYQIRVTDASGKLIWESPKVKDIDNPLVFGNWDFGYSLPELVTDIDGDGAVELVAPAPQSDVSPTCFRVFRWKGDRFVPVRVGILLESPRGSGSFPWSQSEDYQGRWISSFKKANPDGTLRVAVFEYDGETATGEGEALVTRTPKGYQFRKWVVPMKSLSGTPSSEIDGSLPDEGAVVYRARLGSRDHFNSAGKRLEEVGAILRQDRANYHKGKGDQDDGPDPSFRTAKDRNGMDARKPVPVGMAAKAWRKLILNGTPLVEVEVTDQELRVRIVEP